MKFVNIKLLVASVLLGLTCSLSASELRVKAFIDGRSDLIVNLFDVHWHHYDFAAPGTWGPSVPGNQPTFLNEQPWFPTWPQPGFNYFCDCDSSPLYHAFLPALIADGSPIFVVPISARGTVSVVQQPTLSNGHTAIIEFNDNGLTGAAWYEVSIFYNSGTALVQDLIDAAVPGATIQIPAGTFVGHLIIDKDLTLQGTGSATTIFDGNFAVAPITINPGGRDVALRVTLRDLQIARGGGFSYHGNDQGADLENWGGIVTLDNCVIRDGQAGGIASTGSLTLNNCIVSANSTSFVTGKIGGGVTSTGTLTLNNCVVSGNSSLDTGGAGGISSLGNLVMHNCTVAGNLGLLAWGGIRHAGSADLINCAIISNGPVDASCFSGGGISASGTMTLINCTISGNRRGHADGGGIENSGTLLLDHCTVAANQATFGSDDIFCPTGNGGNGGGILNQSSGIVVVKDSIVANNSSDIAGPDFLGTLTSAGFNLIGNTSGTTITGNSAGNILNIDPLLGPLQNNGGPTQTQALQPGSPAIDAGDCLDLNGQPLATDQRGVDRPQGLRCDIGAFEAQASGCQTDNVAPNVGYAAIKPFQTYVNPLRRVGVFQFSITDNCDGNPVIYIQDSATGFLAGPFHNGDRVEIAKGPALANEQILTPNGPNVAAVHLKGGARMYGVDRAGNVSLLQKVL